MYVNETVFQTDKHIFVEKVMSDLGIEWSTKLVFVSDVDIKDNTYQTRQNVAESSASVAKEYADKIKNGESFPMIVLQEKSPGRYRVICGRHRATAYALAQNGKCSYEAYVVDARSRQNDLWALSARENNANGVRQSNADTARAAACELFKTAPPSGSRCHKGVLINEFASRFGANKHTVRDHYFARLVESEMVKVGVQHVGVPVSVLRGLWPWTQSADWKDVAKAVAGHARLQGLSRLVSQAKADKVDAKTLVSRIVEASDDASETLWGQRPLKDPATVTLEHLSLALHDMRDLAPPRNLPDELADEISSMVEAIRIECKEWKAR